ncbi:lipopolysaccharide biosynthesis protein [Hafnia paralvei]|uniref:Teichuronic acid biosynthesis protein TuaB n=1 Tax=Hafnia alvei TaxID=569 RepID=A0A172WZW5_HAFAL|nr:lipopolysaccharide biosynthesis protein [Hafnia paralvei]ANF29914.1 teichuronic acid biosynthesis protein TuaB [Hafnia alvei]TBM00970.1 lipopolysaccharide biosynthesis protein [Hafnia paralvei]
MSIFNNLKWNAVSQIFKIATQVVSMVYLARLIPPAEYGIMAMATVITNFAVLFRDLGTSAAIIQKDNLDETTTSSVFWLNSFLGLVVSIIIIITSPLLSYIYHQPQLISILILLSLNFLISGTSSLHLALLERKSQFNIIAKIEIFSFLIALIVAIVMAAQGFGVYSLVCQSLVSTFGSACLLWHYSPWRPKGRPKNMIANLKQIYKFSSQLSLFNIINYFSRNLDSFLIGRYMPASTLGAYNLAYRIMLFPLTSLTFIANRSLFPILSQKKNNYNDIEKIYLNTIYLIWFITLPFITIISSLNDVFILAIFGNNWLLSADILIWLAPTAIIQSVLSTTGTIFMSQGRTGILLALGIQGTILTGLAFLIGIQHGIVELAKYYFIANVVHFIPCMFFTMHIIRSKLLKVIIKTYPLFFSAGIAYILLWNLKTNFDNSLSSLIILSLIGFSTYIVLLLPTRSIRDYISKKRYSSS